MTARESGSHVFSQGLPCGASGAIIQRGCRRRRTARDFGGMAAMVRRYQRFWKFARAGLLFPAESRFSRADFLCETMKSLPDIHKTIETLYVRSRGGFSAGGGIGGFLYVDFKLHDPVPAPPVYRRG